MNRVHTLLAGLIVLVAVAAAVLGAALKLEPADAWTSADEPVTGAPTAQTLGAEDLVAARRAAGEAASQTGLLTTGTSDLVDGTTQLDDGAGQLTEGIGTAAAGAQELSGGMTELQAGVGQLGQGATRIADGVQSATEPLVGMGAVRGQILESMNRTITALEGNPDPEAVRARAELISVRDQAQNIPLDEASLAQVTELRDGARELANQLAVPGYGFHDGVYTATKAAKDLSGGLAELDAGAGRADEAIGSLTEGAQKIDTLAENTDAKIDELNRALPAPAWNAAATESGERPRSVLPPQTALLIAALAMLAGLAIGVGAWLLPSRRWLILGVGTLGSVLAGTVALFVLSAGLGVGAVLGSAGLLALATAASAAATYVLVALAGPLWGAVIAAVVGIAQLGLVGWVWRVAATSEVSMWLRVLADLSPLHWATTSLTALGNAGSPTSLWTGVAALAVVSVIGGVALGRASAGRREAVL